MGFSYTRNWLTNRMVLCCDFCGANPARKIRCPYGYCQAWATCANCRKAGKHKVASTGLEKREGHAICKERIDASSAAADKFTAGGLNLPLRYCEKYGYIIDTEHEDGGKELYYASCDVTRRTWHDTPDTLAKAYGHTFFVSRVTDN